eukprot:TRINITY_DN3776_c0_g1_i4.p1 TRINITY_DN3776_c0_g1~~TRINITY_DN3776_c0_g1_i4.p1  ORF type:complete len:222 (-),score=34.64 TRINITY_DN3776_c0_g1_i4:63-728(-)
MASTVDASRVAERVDEPDTVAEKVKLLAEMVGASGYTVFFTGAGVSTSSGVGDYRGPSGAWTKRRIADLEAAKRTKTIKPDDEEELDKLLAEKARELKKATKKVDMMEAEPSVSHMAQATLIRLGLAHHVVTTNLDGIYRKAGLKGHEQLTCLHGDVYIERCTNCHYDFERNYHTRRLGIHVHDHHVGTCSRCGSAAPAGYTGVPTCGAKTGGSKKFQHNG